MKSFQIFPAKILLFGEYSVLFAGNALSFPSFQFTGKLSYPDSGNEKNYNSNLIIQNLYNYLITNENFRSLFSKFQFDNLKTDIDKGLFFDSNIPIGYGIGSSGALCASIYYHYFYDSTIANLYDHKKYLSQIEDFFHNFSSGFDPLVSLLKKPIFLEKNIQPVIIHNIDFVNHLDIYLLNSQIIGKTKDAMNDFLHKLNTDSTKKSAFKKFIDVTNICIEYILKADKISFIKHIESLSLLQLEEFNELIPENVKSIWNDGLRNKKFFLKLCGSGGGGFFLLFNNTCRRQSELSNQLIKLSF